MTRHTDRTGRAVRALAAAALLGALAAACHVKPGVGPVPSAGRETTITESEIRAMGAVTAWDVVRARAPRLVAAREQGGRPTGVRIQEPRSVNADESPLLVVDGVQMYDLSWLDQIPASEVSLIRVLDAEAAQPLYGLRAAGGAIVVTTRGAR